MEIEPGPYLELICAALLFSVVAYIFIVTLLMLLGVL